MKYQFHLISYSKTNWIKRLVNYTVIGIWALGMLVVAIKTNKDLRAPFLFGLMAGIYLLGFLKFKPNGKLRVNDIELLHITSKQTKVWTLDDPDLSLELYYYYKPPTINYDSHFTSRLGGIRRYSLFPSKEESEETLDRIVINGERLNLKIRSMKEAKKLEELIDHLYEKAINIKVFSTKYQDIFNDEGRPYWSLKAEKA